MNVQSGFGLVFHWLLGLVQYSVECRLQQVDLHVLGSQPRHHTPVAVLPALACRRRHSV